MRGPFEGTWQQGIRPTVVTAPDALVYFNGESQIIGCASCQRRFDLNKYITSIQVDLNVDSVPGSASINMSIPRHSVDEFYFDGNPMITPMMEVEIFAKGYFLLEGLPQYYPIFWGLVTEVSDNYSGGEHTFTISCADILKWWELCKMNVTPAFGTSGQLGKNLFGNVLYGTNPYDVIWSLAQQAFGDVVVGASSLTSAFKESVQPQTFSTALADVTLYWQQRFSKIRSNLLLYGTQGNAVRGDLIDATYQANGGGKKFENSRAVPIASQIVRQANGGAEGSQMVFDPTDPAVTAFRTQFSQAGQVNFWQSEFQTKLEIATTCKEAIGFEFFMDVTGDIVFKPPFYNLDVLSNKPVSWIQDIDIIDWDLSESEAEVVTQLQISGSYRDGNIDYGLPDEVTPRTQVTDYHLLRKYGTRVQTVNSEFSASTDQMFLIGLDMLDRINAKRHRGSVTIPMRPELRLGFPIYLAPKDQVWYVSGLSHSIQFGGRAQTTLTLTAKRSKFVAPKGIGTIELTGYSGGGGKSPPDGSIISGLTSKQLAAGGRFKVTVGDAAQMPQLNAPTSPSASNPYEPLILRHPKTGRLLGYPQVVMAYTSPLLPSVDKKGAPTTSSSSSSSDDQDRAAIAKLIGARDYNSKRPVAQARKTTDTSATKITAQTSVDQLTANNKDRLRAKYINNRYSYGLTSAGVFTYLFDKIGVIQEVVIPSMGNVTFGSVLDTINFINGSGMIRPVSDERGFELVGHFRYGRGVSLRDGSLVLNQSSSTETNSAADVNFALAMSGDLAATLQAQSMGLVTSSGVSANPSKTLATLQPDDLESAAAINPDTKQPEFINTSTNFVDVAPLGSPKQAGATNTTSQASVEAGQLSRALTLAEMAVQDAVVPLDECDCLLGRSDLSFIAVGYQIKTIGSSTPTSAGQPATDAARAQAAALLQQQDKAVADGSSQALSQVQSLRAQGASPEQIQAAQQKLETVQTQIITQFQSQHADEIQAVQSQIGDFPSTSTGNEPVADFTMTQAQTISKVESFLTGLYKALDTSHQQYESIIRGDSLSLPQTPVDDIRFSTPEPLSAISPPYSVPGRSLGGGDPLAQALQARSDLDSAVAGWPSVSASLQAPAKRAQLQQEIQDLTNQANQLARSIEAAAEAGQPPDPNAQAALNKVEQQLANKEQQLNVLNASVSA